MSAELMTGTNLSAARHIATALLVAGATFAAADQQSPVTPYVPKQSDRPEALAGDETGFQPIFDGKLSTDEVWQFIFLPVAHLGSCAA